MAYKLNFVFTDRQFLGVKSNVLFPTSLKYHPHVGDKNVIVAPQD
jgi:hypothetical protein